MINTQARQEEHHRFLDKLGFPGELEPENARYTPVIEDDPLGHRYVPWAVNEAGQNLGVRHYDDALTMPQLGRHTKRGVVEGGNSMETPVSELNTTISKSQDFFNWMENIHSFKKSCPCESCFQKAADYKGTVEKATNFLAQGA